MLHEFTCNVVVLDEFTCKVALHDYKCKTVLHDAICKVEFREFIGKAVLPVRLLTCLNSTPSSSALATAPHSFSRP